MNVIHGHPAAVWHLALLAALAVAGWLMAVHAVRDHRALARLNWRIDWLFAGGQKSAYSKPQPEVPHHHSWFESQPAAVRTLVSLGWGLFALAALVGYPGYAGAVTIAITAADAIGCAVLFRPRGKAGSTWPGYPVPQEHEHQGR